MLNRLREQQTQAYERKRTNHLMGNRKKDGMSSVQLGGAMTLEQMNLDRKEEFTGDEYDPFNMQQK